MILAIPQIQHMPSYIAALKEGHSCGGDGKKDAETIARIEADPQTFLDILLGPQPDTRLNENGERVERVPDSPFWFVEGDTFIGDARIRHRLNAALEQFGGHIGYGIRPSMQGKGYATELLRQCLIWSRENLKIDRALLTCRTDNIASARVIEKNGGQLIDTTPHPYAAGITQKRYWVPVPRTLPRVTPNA